MSRARDDGHGILGTQLAQLLDAAIESAQSTLNQRGGFLPGSIACDRDSKLRLTVAAVGGTEGSNMLAIALRRQAAAGEINAVALYRDVRVRPEGESQDVDAIHVVLEDARGLAFQAFQVYRKGSDRNYAYDQVVVEPGVPAIFLDLSVETSRKKKWWELWK